MDLPFGLVLGTISPLALTRMPDAEHQRLLHNGKLLDAAWPKLTSNERKLISHALPAKTLTPPARPKP